MKITLDKTGNIYKTILNGLTKSEREEIYRNDLTVGIYDNDNNFLAGIIFHTHNKYTIYLTVYAKSPRWFTREFDKWIYQYIFKDLKYKKIGCHCSSSNQKSKRFLDKYGFCFEGVERYSRKDGSHNFIYGITEEEFFNKRIKRYG